MPPISVELSPDLENRLHVLLERLHLTPANMSGSGAGSEYEEHNMIMNYQIADFEPRPRQSAQLISWCPPLENWNPWIACNIDEGPEVSISMQEL